MHSWESRAVAAIAAFVLGGAPATGPLCDALCGSGVSAEIVARSTATSDHDSHGAPHAHHHAGVTAPAAGDASSATATPLGGGCSDAAAQLQAALGALRPDTTVITRAATGGAACIHASAARLHRISSHGSPPGRPPALQTPVLRI